MSGAPCHLVLATPPGHAGGDALLSRIEGRPARILLVGAGLAWGTADARAGWEPHHRVAVCSQDARGAGWTAKTAPRGVRWSSVGTWMAELPSDAVLWIALP